ncbi:hypothetical protein KKG45_01670 [bacterium]|nr:hypothetical protein [bacterium]MBU1071934.1 hypothetical protein [bacterium]MBU1676995.1 hypothetical protein [bacterium]
MREVSDIELRLRAAAVDPGVRVEHFDLLRADLRARYHRRRRRPLLVTAACIFFVSLVVFQEDPLESFSYRFNSSDVVDGTTGVFKTHDGAKNSILFSQAVDWTTQPLTQDDALEARRKLELELQYFMSGQMDLYHADAYTYRGQTEFALFYRADVEGETIRHVEILDRNQNPDFESFLTGGGMRDLIYSRINGELTELNRETLFLDGHNITFKRWLARDPVHGEIVMWLSDSIN